MALSTITVWLRGAVAVVPPRRVPVTAVLASEADRVARQLGALSDGFRTRLEPALGLEQIPVHDGPPSALARTAVERALAAARLDPATVDAVIDFSTLPGDHAAIWSLAHAVQAELPGGRALALGVRGAGCAGFHLALRTAQALLADGADRVLLVASDRCHDGGRVSLPVSVMSDAASALLVTRDPPSVGPRVRLRSVALVTVGGLCEIIRAVGDPPRIEVDSAAFERQVVPVHFVLCQRVLGQALSAAGRSVEQLSALVYPNTSDLDRHSVARALGRGPGVLSGPGPRDHGHAFASDMVVNLPADGTRHGGTLAWLAVGSGFTWGAAVADVEPGA